MCPAEKRSEKMRDFLEELREMVVQSNLPGIIGAVLVLFIGWLIALWISGMVAAAAVSCCQWRKQLPGAEGDSDSENAGKMASKITYWIVMILVLLGCMSLLQLEYAAIPLREFLTVMAKYLPNIAGALLLIVIARITAGIVRAGVRKFMSRKLPAEGEENKWNIEQKKTLEFSVQGAGFVVYLFFLPAILNALEIYGITAPLQAMFAVALVYLPRIVAALVILFVGFWVARIIRKGVCTALTAAKIDDAVSFMGFKSEGGKFAKSCAYIVWAVTVIPIVIAALTALDIAPLTQSISGFLNMLLFGAGNIVGALLVLVATLFVAKISDKVVRRLSSAVGIDGVWKEMGVEQDKIPEFTLSAATGKCALIAVWVLGIIAACEILNFEQLAKILRNFALFGGNLIVSVIVLMIGIALAQFVNRLVGDKIGRVWSYTVKITVIVFTVALALSNLNIGQAIVETAFAMILGALCLAGALAFGFGGREFAANLLEKLNKGNCSSQSKKD